MYLDYLVKIPDALGKIVCQKKKYTIYVYYVIGRTYDPDKKYTTPKRVTIGKRSKDDNDLMQPNENFLRYFPDQELPEKNDRTNRSSCLRIGSYLVIRSVLKELGIPEILSLYFNEKDLGLFLDLVAYSIIAENNSAQYYPDYAYNHPLFTRNMQVYSDSKVSEFLNSITYEQSTGFLNDWNSNHDHRQKIYISYDSTNKNCQAGDIEMIEFGAAKDDKSLPIFNYYIAYDTTNSSPLFYEKYPGSINNVSQLQFMLDKAKAYGYKKIGFILDRGYFSKANIEYMDECGYSFVIMVKGMGKKSNYMTVHASIRELEKIEMLRQLDDVYRLDHAVTATQKTILNAFGIKNENIKYRAAYISEELKG